MPLHPDFYCKETRDGNWRVYINYKPTILQWPDRSIANRAIEYMQDRLIEKWQEALVSGEDNPEYIDLYHICSKCQNYCEYEGKEGRCHVFYCLDCGRAYKLRNWQL